MKKFHYNKMLDIFDQIDKAVAIPMSTAAG